MARSFVRASSQFLSNGVAPATAPAFTMACWVNPATLPSAQEVMCLGDTGSTNNRHGIQIINTGAVRAQSQDATTTSSALTTATLGTGAWTHLCGVWAATNSRSIFLNGGGKVTNTATRTPTGIDTVSIGRTETSAPSQYFDGRIAEAGIWNVALTDAEVAILALGVSPLLVRPASLVAYWPLIGRASPEICRKGDFPLTVTGATAADHCRIIRARGGVRMGVPSSGAVHYSIAGAVGAFTLAGQSAGLLAARKITGAVGSFTETGQAAGLRAARRIGGDAGAFALSGQAVNLLYGRRVVAAAGAFLHSGQSAGLFAGRRLAMGAGAFAFTGNVAGLTTSQLLTMLVTVESGGDCIASGGISRISGSEESSSGGKSTVSPFCR